MRHEHVLRGYAFGLRPVALEDAAFIVDLRTSGAHRTQYLHAISPDVSLQEQWITRYLARENDYYWVIERLDTAVPEGLIGIYAVDTAAGRGEWGRWILKQGSLAATESALLCYRIAFEVLGLREVYCVTAAENQQVVSFHESSGLIVTGTLPQHLPLGDRVLDAVQQSCDVSRWPHVRSILEPRAQAIARRGTPSGAKTAIND
ncbi:MAG: hypothetical protein JWM95_3151 [Gemmatimonadetes bacterium]|nr:hypothetical protein [Gemmatimonadota bacterium]